uniref:DUF1573 domain-containing protein n=3 Tax=Sinorhizobium/Ensifer group TaxID=227292 RepID=A0A142BPN6_9HYPH|nr:hypothetical protein pSinB_185 [Sinorhizobium sp. M14]
MRMTKSRRRTIAAGKATLMRLLLIATMAGGAAVAAYTAIAPPVPRANYSQILPAKVTQGATLAIDREVAELGVLAVDEVGRAGFRLKNSGTEPIEISQVRTSCMCTFADIALPRGNSPEFNMAMHNDAAVNAWKGVLDPGEEATVTVVYKPSLMPVEGSVARNVKFATNDPQKPVVELDVHATVKGATSG